jgi:flagellar basal-body rod protein FlgC
VISTILIRKLKIPEVMILGDLSLWSKAGKVISSIDNSLAALKVFMNKMRVTANNIANVNTDGFKKSRALISEGPGGVPMTNVVQIDTPGPPNAAAHDDPTLDEELSNVELTEEIPQLMLSQRGFQANLKTLKAQDEMLGTILDIMS